MGTGLLAQRKKLLLLLLKSLDEGIKAQSGLLTCQGHTAGQRCLRDPQRPQGPCQCSAHHPASRLGTPANHASSFLLMCSADQSLSLILFFQNTLTCSTEWQALNPLTFLGLDGCLSSCIMQMKIHALHSVSRRLEENTGSASDMMMAPRAGSTHSGQDLPRVCGALSSASHPAKESR